MSEISAERFRSDIGFLAADAMRGRPTPSFELDEAARYIAHRLAEAGVAPGDDVTGFAQSFDCGGGPRPASNVVGRLRGSGDEVVVVSAHYDHIGTAAEGEDRIFNGANDNASGVAAMLAVARASARMPGPRVRTVAFIAFCGEELGLNGSRHYAHHPMWPLDRTVAMVNLEMLGHPDPADPSRAWISGYHKSTLADTLATAAEPEGVTFVPGHAIGPIEAEAFARSDNFPLAQRGVVAHTVAAGPLDAHYHAVTDDPSRVDYAAMVPLVRAIARGVQVLARGGPPPRWTHDHESANAGGAGSTMRTGSWVTG